MKTNQIPRVVNANEGERVRERELIAFSAGVVKKHLRTWCVLV